MSTDKPPLIGVAQHPRAALSIRRWKSAGSLAGFAAAAGGSWMHHSPLFDSGVRGLVGAGVGYLLAYGLSVTVWQSMLQAEARIAVQRSREAARRRMEAPRQPGGD